MKTSRNMAVVVAAGTGSRCGGDLPKQFQPLGGKPMVVHCLELFEKSALIDEVVLVVSAEYLPYASRSIVDQFGLRKVRKVTSGGETRQESVLAGLSACPTGIDFVAIHDAARPFITKWLFEEAMAKAAETGAAILAVPARESIKVGENGFISRTLKRDTIWVAQTPQVFRFGGILDAHRRAQATQNESTDDSELYEQYGGRVAIVHGSYENIKITSPEDMVLAQEIIRGRL